MEIYFCVTLVFDIIDGPTVIAWISGFYVVFIPFFFVGGIIISISKRSQ